MRRSGNKAVSWLVVAAVTAMLSPVSMAFAAVANDEVTSVKLKEADGTSGQNTNSGSGVKTGHIQDGAVITSKILDGAVTDAKISGLITGSKLGAHAHNSSDIVGTISISNLPIGTAAGTIAADDHNHDAIYQKKYGSVAVVATSGGDYSSPEAALEAVSTWCSTAPCLVKVMPGTYTSSSNGLSGIVIKKHVTLEGSGEGSTNIICGSMFLYNDGEVRSLTITSPAPINAYYTPVAPDYANSTGPAIVRNVTLNTTSNDGTGVVNYNANLELTNVKINVSGPGNGTGAALKSIFNFTKLNNVTMSLHNGGTAIVASYYSNVYVNNSSIIAPTTATALTTGDYPGAIYVNNSQINGQIVPAGGTIKCIGAFNASYDAVTCQ